MVTHGSLAENLVAILTPTLNIAPRPRGSEHENAIGRFDQPAPDRVKGRQSQREILPGQSEGIRQDLTMSVVENPLHHRPDRSRSLRSRMMVMLAS